MGWLRAGVRGPGLPRPKRPRVPEFSGTLRTLLWLQTIPLSPPTALGCPKSRLYPCSPSRAGEGTCRPRRDLRLLRELKVGPWLEGCGPGWAGRAGLWPGSWEAARRQGLLHGLT